MSFGKIMIVWILLYGKMGAKKTYKKLKRNNVFAMFIYKWSII